MGKNNKKVVYENDDPDSIPFNTRLRAIRIKRGISTVDLANRIGRIDIQVQRYETQSKSKQHPQLSVFRKICVELQIDPRFLLGLKIIDEDENGVIYKWALFDQFTRLRWKCPKCKRMNSTYGDWGKKKYNVKKGDFDMMIDKKKIKRTTFICEYDDCSEYFERLDKLDES